MTKFIRSATSDDLVELRRGKGYFYFIGGKADEFYQQGVYVNRLILLTHEQWLSEYKDKLGKL